MLNARRRLREDETWRRQLLAEIEVLRDQHGIRITAAVALVAERHSVDVDVLTVDHFRWLLRDVPTTRALNGV